MAGRDVDVNELHETSPTGSAAGAATGAAVGALAEGGPAGAGPGFVIGGAVEPARAAMTSATGSRRRGSSRRCGLVPTGHSAIVLLSSREHADALVQAAGDAPEAEPIRRELGDADLRHLPAGLDAPPASG